MFNTQDTYGTALAAAISVRGSAKSAVDSAVIGAMYVGGVRPVQRNSCNQ